MWPVIKTSCSCSARFINSHMSRCMLYRVICRPCSRPMIHNHIFCKALHTLPMVCLFATPGCYLPCQGSAAAGQLHRVPEHSKAHSMPSRRPVRGPQRQGKFGHTLFTLQPIPEGSLSHATSNPRAALLIFVSRKKVSAILFDDYLLVSIFLWWWLRSRAMHGADHVSAHTCCAFQVQK